MKHSLALLTVIVSLALLPSCKIIAPERGGGGFNPAASVDLSLSSFNVENSQSAPNALQETLFWDVYTGIEPVPDAGNHPLAADVVALLRQEINQFAGTSPSGDSKTYIRSRNPWDLMNWMIGENQVINFNDGRRYIADRIRLNAPGTYNTRSNGALIRFRDQSAEQAGLPLAESTWIYSTLSWVYTPQSSNKVIRTLQYTARQPSGPISEEPELLSLATGSQFDPGSFSALGYNAPERREASLTLRNRGRVAMVQDFLAQQDTLVLSENTFLTLNGQTINCLRVELDYAMARAEFFTSNDDLNVPDGNKASCSTADTPAGSFAIVSIAERQ
ncbi:MAG: hypothetical protein LAT63_04720 [Marinobacter sp.]|nr:hypothetical protein [Marinobacter sp.]